MSKLLIVPKASAMFLPNEMSSGPNTHRGTIHKSYRKPSAFQVLACYTRKPLFSAFSCHKPTLFVASGELLEKIELLMRETEQE